MKTHRAKRQGLGLEFRSFPGKSGKNYLVFRTTKDSFHVFVETEAKDAALDCGAETGNTRKRWKMLWDTDYQVKLKQQPEKIRTPRSRSRRPYEYDHHYGLRESKIR